MELSLLSHACLVIGYTDRLFEEAARLSEPTASAANWLHVIVELDVFQLVAADHRLLYW